MTTSAIVLDGLVVERGGKRILDKLSFSLSSGSVYALLGGNGAGKTTALLAMLGLVKVTAGSVIVAGKDPMQDAQAVRQETAYLAENAVLYEHLSARENVAYFLGLAGQKRTRTEIEEAFASVRLVPAAWDRRLGTFSKGMRQKTAIACALLRQTKVLLLDEPTSGLDPEAIADFQTLIGDLTSRGVSIFMVTHDVMGAAESANVIGMLAGGCVAREWRDGAGRYPMDELYRAISGRTHK
jgi:ABC-2 type transport system ATP-binding protein